MKFMGAFLLCVANMLALVLCEKNKKFYIFKMQYRVYF